MKSLLFAALLISTSALALQPADVQMTTDPATAVTVQPRIGNTSKSIIITVNKQDRVTANGRQLYPVPVYTKVADENGAFTIAALAGKGFSVRYGAGTTWVARDLPAGAYKCDNATFTDPIVGTVKECDIYNVPVPIPPPPPPNVPPVVPHMHAGVQGILWDNPILASYDGLGFMPGTTQLMLSVGGTLPEPADPANWEQDGALRTFCKASHHNNDDPIVYPGQKDAAHDHMHFSPGTDYTLTDANVRAPGVRSTCRGGSLDNTRRWAAATYDTVSMQGIIPHGLLMYYKTGFCTYSIACSGSADLVAATMLNIHWVPEHLHIIAGDPTATKPTGIARYACMMTNGNARVEDDVIPQCLAGEALWEMVHLPNCLAVHADGSPVLDSPDHKSHAAYMESWPTWSSPTPGKAFRCPLDHPYQIVQIDFKQVFEISAGMDTSKWSLSCGSAYCLHVDWFDGWQQDIMQATSVECLQKRRDCGTFQINTGQTALEFEGN